MDPKKLAAAQQAHEAEARRLQLETERLQRACPHKWTRKGPAISDFKEMNMPVVKLQGVVCSYCSLDTYLIRTMREPFPEEVGEWGGDDHVD